MIDLERASELCEQLGEIFCLTLVKGVDESEALRRMGGYPDTVRPRTWSDAGNMMQDFDLGYPRMAAAVPLDGWSLVIEPEGFHGSDQHLLCAMSRGTEALDVLRHDYAASHHVGYAVDGTMIVGFPPESATPNRIWGADPERLREDMSAVGLLPSPDGYVQDGPARAMLLAERITGTRIPADLISDTPLSAQIEPWFVTGPIPGDLLRPDPYSARSDGLIRDLVDAAEAATPAVQRSVAVAEVRRQATVLGLVATPGLAEHLTRAVDGDGELIGMTSDLGHHVRAWLGDQDRATWSLNDGYRHRMTNEQRTAAYALGWFTTALRGASHPDPRTAVLTALKPLSSGIRVFDGPQTAATILRTLRSPVNES